MSKHQEQRKKMVDTQLKPRGISDNSVLKAFRSVPREKFVLSDYRKEAYTDRPLPIGHNITTFYSCINV